MSRKGKPSVYSTKVLIVFGIVAYIGLLFYLANYSPWSGRQNDSTKPPVIGTPNLTQTTNSPTIEPTVPSSNIIPNADNWIEYFPKCRAISDNLRISVPSHWKVGADFPIYDGPYSNNPTTQEEKDFNNYVSQCQIIIGFTEKPLGYQDFTPGDYGTIDIAVNKVEVPKNLQDIESNIRKNNANDPSISTQYETIKGIQFLVVKKSRNPVSYLTIRNGARINISLQVRYSTTNTEVIAYIQKTYADLMQRIVIK